jgi:hypothetical protein
MVFLSAMTPRRFGQLCGHPESLCLEDGEVLREILTLYPYLNEARIFQVCWDIAFGGENHKDKLESDTLYAGNRLLFSYMIDDARPKAPEPEPEEIIERFLKKEPRIQPRKDYQPAPDERLDRSVVDEGGMVSETLARIHANQGSYRKAIEIYNKLSLKFPGKSSYFAARIKELEDKLSR